MTEISLVSAECMQVQMNGLYSRSNCCRCSEWSKRRNLLMRRSYAVIWFAMRTMLRASLIATCACAVILFHDKGLDMTFLSLSPKHATSIVTVIPAPVCLCLNLRPLSH